MEGQDKLVLSGVEFFHILDNADQYVFALATYTNGEQSITNLDEDGVRSVRLMCQRLGIAPRKSHFESMSSFISFAKLHGYLSTQGFDRKKLVRYEEGATPMLST